ncbi:alpha/beta hydrolase family protein [Kordiimonas laminariae]|uniref:alpha/beta hydrolase family protein n=1 Tax=Kordiimonas laminariae TaxID=2917717 RepID=UPI001FF638F0|nr:prolyl oligopeptidase family serine peptidase [Kordiimonas laminariae]MCK0068406.1 prolyl oligopeptidase family serine peptidase [Kordiimonas laminariae]
MKTFFMMWIAGVFLLGAQVSLKPAQAENAELFAELPQYEQATLSPSGDKIAHISTIDDTRYIVVQSLVGKQPILIPPYKKLLPERLMWANEETLLIWLYVTKTDTNITVHRLIAHNVVRGKSRWLGKPNGKKQEATSFREELVDLLPNDPKHVLISLDSQDNFQRTIYKSNLTTGKHLLREKGGKRGIQTWVTDHNSEVRFGYGSDRRSSKAIFTDRDRTGTVYKTRASEWINLNKQSWFDGLYFIGFTDNTNIILVESLTQYGTRGIFRFDMAAKKLLEPLFSMPGIDYLRPLTNPLNGHIIGVSYPENGSIKYFYFDKKMKAVQGTIDKALKTTSNHIISFAKDKPLYLIKSSSPHTPAQYYLYDRANKQISLWAQSYPTMTETALVHTETHIITNRDNTPIETHIAFPKGYKENVAMPAIMMLHNGLSSYQSTNWDTYSAYLNSRGYIVIKPNPRGTRGFGAEHEYAAKNQWGGIPQDDIIDVARWLKKQGISNNICTMGVWHGAYSTAMSAIKAPDTFKCLISINGIFDLAEYKRTYLVTHPITHEFWNDFISLKNQPDKFASPYHRADENNVPGLYIFADDIHSPYSQKPTRLMYKRLKKLKRRATYVETKDGGIALNTKRSRLKALTAIKKFLDEEMPIQESGIKLRPGR